MLAAMFKAQVGDDVFGEDPTVNQLESISAALFGTDAALFCPSGTMSNQIAIKAHTQPGEEIICDQLSHVYIYEGGGIAFNSSCQVKPLEGNRGRINAAQVEAAINPYDIHKPISSLVSVENTSNRGGGSCYQMEDLKAIKKVCQQHGLKFHLDGARIWNAMIANNENPKQYGEIFDSISICLSKGLGAPIGSVLLGNVDFIKKARRLRKVFGGGMRQAGYLAAAGIYALENNINRLELDHQHAKSVGNALAEKSFVGKITPIETNIIIAEIINNYTAQSFVEHLKKHHIYCIPISSTQIRMVFHLDVTPSMVETIIAVITEM
jgi:threonine aldolase